MNARAATPARHPRVGAWVKIPAPEVLESLHAGGLTLVLIDCEHGAIDRRAMWTLVGMGRALGLEVMVRLPGHRPEDAQAALDAGADGLIVPRVDDADEARTAVDAVRLPPLGRRGGSPGTRAGGWGLKDAAALTEHGNRHVQLVVQIESPRAVAAVASILAVDGLDGVMVGPFDLALAAGQRPGDPGLDPLLERVEHAAKGRVLGGIAADPAQAARLLDRGYSFVVAAADTSILVAGARALTEAGNPAPA